MTKMRASYMDTDMGECGIERAATFRADARDQQ
jgi:hypothetical protein